MSGHLVNFIEQNPQYFPKIIHLTLGFLQEAISELFLSINSHAEHVSAHRTGLPLLPFASSLSITFLKFTEE